MSKCVNVMESRRCVQLRIESNIGVISAIYPPSHPLLEHHAYALVCRRLIPESDALAGFTDVDIQRFQCLGQ